MIISFLSVPVFPKRLVSKMRDLKFNVMQNPNGILYDPSQHCMTLYFLIVKIKLFDEDDLFRVKRFVAIAGNIIQFFPAQIKTMF